MFDQLGSVILRGLLSAAELCWAFFRATDSLKAFLRADEHCWVLLGTSQHCWAVLSPVEYYWAFFRATEKCFWELLSTAEHCSVEHRSAQQSSALLCSTQQLSGLNSALQLSKTLLWCHLLWKMLSLSQHHSAALNSAQQQSAALTSNQQRSAALTVLHYPISQTYTANNYCHCTAKLWCYVSHTLLITLCVKH